MPNEYEAFAKMLMNTPQASKMLGNLEKVSEIINSPEGRQLMAMLAEDGGDVVKKAAAAAVSDDKDGARALLTHLLSTKEGTALAAKFVGLMGE